MRPSCSRFSLSVSVFLLALLATSARAEWPVNGRDLCPVRGGMRWPQLAADGSGGAIVAWVDYRDDLAGDIYAQHVLSNGSLGWTDQGLPISTTPDIEQTPQVVSDGVGGAFIAWLEVGESSIWLQHVAGGGPLSNGWPPGGIRVREGFMPVTEVQMSTDSRGGVYVVWTELQNGGSDIYVQHVNADGTLAFRWPVNGLPLTRALGYQFDPRLAPDGLGGLIVAWTDQRNEPDVSLGDVYAQRITASGVLAYGWAEDGIPICSAGGFQGVQTPIADGTGGMFIVWEDHRSGVSTIYVSRITATGELAPGWTPRGRADNEASAIQFGPVAIADGSGGAIVVWLDARDLPTYSLYATRITASGVPEPDWTTTGVRVAVTLPGRDGVIGDLALAPDGLGGSFFTWTDGSNYDSSRADIRAQHLTGAGETATGWPTAGLSLTTAAGDQLNGGLAADGAGGAIATWFDAGGNPIVEDVYASRLSPTLPLPEPPPPKSFAVIAVAPNPTDATSTILFDLPAAAPVRAEVYDATGHQVRVLAEGEELPAGRRSLRWDGLGSEGGRARAGLYFVRVSGGGSVGHAKLVRIR